MKNLTDFLKENLNSLGLPNRSLVLERISPTKTNKEQVRGSNTAVEIFNIFRKISENPSILEKKDSSKSSNKD
jgi:hypothetical protein